MIGGLKRKRGWKIGSIIMWVRRINLSERARSVNIFVCYINVHQRMTSAWENLTNNQLERVACPYETN